MFRLLFFLFILIITTTVISVAFFQYLEARAEIEAEKDS